MVVDENYGLDDLADDAFGLVDKAKSAADAINLISFPVPTPASAKKPSFEVGCNEECGLRCWEFSWAIPADPCYAKCGCVLVDENWSLDDLADEAFGIVDSAKDAVNL